MSKEKYKPDYNASKNNEKCFGSIYSSLAQDKAFRELSIGTRYFYFICRVQANSQKGRRCLYNHAKEWNKTYSHLTHFVFPDKHLREFGYNRSNACKYFKELEAAGFIKKIEDNRFNHRVNVYAFSSKWKE